MSLNDTRADWWKKGLVSKFNIVMKFILIYPYNYYHTLIDLGAGVTYGVTTVLVGHPIDTIKSKMQAQIGYEAGNSFKAFSKTIRNQGVIGLYRGSTPQFFGSMMFRSSQFAAYVFVFSYMSGPVGETELFRGLKFRVLAGGFASGVTRAILETPLDYWKIRRQIVKEWRVGLDLTTGWKITLLRGSLLMSVYFCYLDLARREWSNYLGYDAFSPIWGKFCLNGVTTTAAWLTVWPLEYMKSQVQGGYGDESQTLIQRMKRVMNERGGFTALYRGMGPGMIRSFFANGLSMVVMMKTVEKLSPLISK